MSEAYNILKSLVDTNLSMFFLWNRVQMQILTNMHTLVPTSIHSRFTVGFDVLVSVHGKFRPTFGQKNRKNFFSSPGGHVCSRSCWSLTSCSLDTYVLLHAVFVQQTQIHMHPWASAQICMWDYTDVFLGFLPHVSVHGIVMPRHAGYHTARETETSSLFGACVHAHDLHAPVYSSLLLR